MKARSLILLLAALAAGCGEKPKSTGAGSNATPSKASDSSPLSAPADYLGALGKGQQSAVKTVDTSSIKKAIELFNVDTGRFPKDLNELVAQKYLPKVPEAPVGMKLQYDANAGTVSVVKP